MVANEEIKAKAPRWMSKGYALPSSVPHNKVHGPKDDYKDKNSIIDYVTPDF